MINGYSNIRIPGNHLNAIKAKGRDSVEHHVTTEHEDIMNCFNQKGLLSIFEEVKRNNKPLRTNQFTESENINHEKIREQKTKQNEKKKERISHQ